LLLYVGRQSKRQIINVLPHQALPTITYIRLLIHLVNYLIDKIPQHHEYHYRNRSSYKLIKILFEKHPFVITRYILLGKDKKKKILNNFLFII